MLSRENQIYIAYTVSLKKDDIFGKMVKKGREQWKEIVSSFLLRKSTLTKFLKEESQNYQKHVTLYLD